MHLVSPGVVTTLAAVALQEDRDQRRIRELLDSPDLRHVFVIVDEIGGDAPARVEDLVQHMPRLDPVFGKITVSQGIVIDPKHPDKATVFALVMNEQEIQRFKAKLLDDFPSQLDEQKTPDPTVVTQLSGIGQIAVFPGTRATELAALPSKDVPKTALKTPSPPKRSPAPPELVLTNSPEFDGLRVPVVPRRPPPSSDTPTIARSSSNPERSESSFSPDAPDPFITPSLVSSSEVDPADDPQISDRNLPQKTPRPHQSIVLVWVTSRDSATKGRH